MEADEETICRLSLKACENGFEVIKEATKKILKYLLLKLDLSISDEPVMCEHCAENLGKCFSFKTAYLCNDDSSTYFTDDEDNCKLDLPQIYLTNEADINTTSNMEGNDTCCICLQCVTYGSFKFLSNEDIPMTVMLKKYSSVLDVKVSRQSVICILCYESLQNYFTFVTNSLNMEEKIKEYCEIEATNSKARVELNHVIQFLSKDALKVKDDISGLYAVKIKEEWPEGNGNINAKEEMENGVSTVVKEQELDFIEEKIKVETQQGSYKRYSDDSLLLYPDITPVVSDTKMCQNFLKVHVQTHASTAERHLLIYKSPLKAMVYKCDICTYQAKEKRFLKVHMLTHKSTSEIKMHKCYVCTFQTKYRSNLQKHIATHKSPSEVTMYECNICGFKTKRNLSRHMLVHKKISEVTMYTCEICAHQTKYKSALRDHMLKHKSTSEVIMFKCDVCLYQSKYKNTLQEHRLIHKSLSEVTAYKCEMCAYQTKYKSNLQKHLLMHRNKLAGSIQKWSLHISHQD